MSIFLILCFRSNRPYSNLIICPHFPDNGILTRPTRSIIIHVTSLKHQLLFEVRFKSFFVEVHFEPFLFGGKSSMHAVIFQDLFLDSA